MQILLVEPDYKNKYPPLGLMKISSYHKSKGDNVVFYKGLSQELKNKLWDRIYISSLFTFHYKKTIDTINFYKNSVKNLKDIYLGGVLASLKRKEIENKTQVSIIKGLLNIKGKLGYNDDYVIDCLTPDYSIIDPSKNELLTYKYPTSDSYIAYATRGCIRKCEFCAVPLIEGQFKNSHSISHQVRQIEENYGTKRHLLLLDNNILAAGEHFFKIIDDIISLGFGKDAKIKLLINGRHQEVKRIVDFNQGIDARLLVKDKRYIKAISKIAIDPLRIAFDNIRDAEVYVESVRKAAEHGIKILSNYILYNYKDTPEDFYQRLKINIELNEEFVRNGYESRIWSFPMRYCPIFGEYSTNRKFKGINWNRKQLRGIQNILSATHGVVGPKRPFFDKAFGRNVKEFQKIILLPEKYIIDRKIHHDNGDRMLLNLMINSLPVDQKKWLTETIESNDFKSIKDFPNNPTLYKILNIYRVRRN